MRATLNFFVVVLAVCYATTGVGRILADEPIGLKVLYVGNPGSEREKDFTSLLRGYFQQVNGSSPN